MSDNRKYYYIKLKDNYFDQDNIKILESMKNGHIYSLVLIKMYLRASKYNGRLMMTQAIPYEPDNIGTLASVINHDVDHVKEAIRIGCQLDLITIIDGREIWMTEIQNFIGQSSTEADRIRSYRASIKEEPTALPESTEHPVQMYDKSTPEIEIKKELEIEREIKIDYQQIADLYNRTCVSLPKATRLSEKRKKTISTLLKNYNIEEIATAFTKAESSQFLTGQSGGTWKADFDWLINQNNLLKVIEGRYDSNGKHRGSKESYDPEIDLYKSI